MPNDSGTGGFLQPTSSPIEGQALNQFVQQWLVGLTGLDGTMVRPSYQPEPPDVPDAGDAWASFMYGERQSDTFPYIRHDPSGFDELQRHEAMRVLVTFYDLGTNGLADYYAALARDNSAIWQNLEYLESQSFKLMYTDDLQVVPVLIKSRWQYRVDWPVMLRRQITRVYAVNNVQSMNGILYNDVGLPPRALSVPHP